MRELLLHRHDNDRVYIEKMQASIPSIDIRKKTGDPGAAGWHLTKRCGRSRL